MSFEISLVIPAFNESKRLPSTLEALANLKLNEIREVIVVDDGSADATILVAESFEKKLPNLKVLKSGKNFGKGHAIRLGLKAAALPWILIADADMSTPWEELRKLCEVAQSSNADICIGSRDVEGSNILTHQSWLRETLGKSFNLFVRTMTRLPFKDTQCGFKLMKKAMIHPFLEKLVVDRFAWDVEFLVLAQKLDLKIVEVPVTWAHKEESRVHPIFDGFNMLWMVTKLRFKILTRSL